MRFYNKATVLLLAHIVTSDQYLHHIMVFLPILWIIAGSLESAN